jgi:hypothetical protein
VPRPENPVQLRPGRMPRGSLLASKESMAASTPARWPSPRASPSQG